MRVDNQWRQLGWRHSLWSLVRFYRGLGAKQREIWLGGLKHDGSMITGDGRRFRLPDADVTLLLDYLPACEKDTARAFECFRTEAEGLAFCRKAGVAVSVTRTKMEEHHQSPKCLVAAVTAIAKEVCAKRNLTVNASPQARCAWFSERGLHVTARNLDGAIPALTNPTVVWEIKEYWGKTKGGSKMSDALYDVVDGQHRLWAQKFSTFEAVYACVIHMGLNEVQMAEMFLEINDTQKRVPASLRWDLVRLVRPDDDPYAVAASEMVWELATNEESPLYQRIDLTGEQPEISLKQGSLAPELRNLLSAKRGRLARLGFDKQYEVILRYLAAIRALDTSGWRSGQSPFYKARVLRVLLRLLPDVIEKIDRPAELIPSSGYTTLLERIDTDSLAPETIRAAQGSAGMSEIYEQIRKQVLR